MNGSTAARASVAVAISALMLSGCVTRSERPGSSEHLVKSQESIAYEVGPCFGFCSVYNVAIASDGRVSFEGIRHTATLGNKTLEAGASVYRDFSQALAPFRPPAWASATTTCDARISDQQHYRIVWTAADGAKSVLEHDRGCRSPQNDKLNRVLEGAPERLGLAPFAKQITRLGASRGWDRKRLKPTWVGVGRPAALDGRKVDPSMPAADPRIRFNELGATTGRLMSPKGELHHTTLPPDYTQPVSKRCPF